VTFTVYQVDVTTGNSTSLGSGTVGTLLDITDFQSTDNQHYMMMIVDTSHANADTIYGGRLVKVNNAPPFSSTDYSNDVITPRHFMVNDD